MLPCEEASAIKQIASFFSIQVTIHEQMSEWQKTRKFPFWAFRKICGKIILCQQPPAIQCFCFNGVKILLKNRHIKTKTAGLSLIQREN